MTKNKRPATHPGTWVQPSKSCYSHIARLTLSRSNFNDVLLAYPQTLGMEKLHLVLSWSGFATWWSFRTFFIFICASDSACVWIPVCIHIVKLVFIYMHEWMNACCYTYVCIYIYIFVCWHANINTVVVFLLIIVVIIIIIIIRYMVGSPSRSALSVALRKTLLENLVRKGYGYETSWSRSEKESTSSPGALP